MKKLKTLKDICTYSERYYPFNQDLDYDIHPLELQKVAKEWIKELQGDNTPYPDVLKSFPEDMKGDIAKGYWDEEIFRLGTEYGMLSFIRYFFNLEETE